MHSGHIKYLQAAREHGEAAHARALEHGLTPESWLVRRSSLEDVFLRLTGRSLDE